MLINLLAISKISEMRALELKFEFECPGVTEIDLLLFIFVPKTGFFIIFLFWTLTSNADCWRVGPRP